MKSWIFAFVGLSCLFASITGTALAKQGGQKTEAVKATDQKPIKEVKFKLEWITSTKSQPPTSESVVFSAAEGLTTMTNNPVQSSEFYRKVTLHPDLQPDGSYIVDVVVSEANKEQDIQRMSTVAKLKPNETKIIQDRVSKGSNYEFEYTFAITRVQE